MNKIERASLKNKISFSLASGYRVPNVDDIGKVFDSRPGILIVPNPSIKAEKTLSYEINFNHAVKKFNFDASFYLIDFWDILELAPFSLKGNTEIEFEGEGFLLSYSCRKLYPF